MQQLAIEVVIVAVSLAGAMAAVAWLLPGWLRGVPRAALVGLVLGALFHLGFELTGLNAMYCRVGAACRGR